jgi:hypothetical protein
VTNNNNLYRENKQAFDIVNKNLQKFHHQNQIIPKVITTLAFFQTKQQNQCFKN